MTPDTLTVAEFAKALRVNPRTVSRWIEEGLVKARPSDVDGRQRVILRTELKRLVQGRMTAQQLAYAASGAAGHLEAHWRSGYRSAVRAMAEAGKALAAHGATAADHEPDHCADCTRLIDDVVRHQEAARAYAAIAPIASQLYRTVREAARDADTTSGRNRTRRAQLRFASRRRNSRRSSWSSWASRSSRGS